MSRSNENKWWDGENTGLHEADRYHIIEKNTKLFCIEYTEHY